MLRRLAPVLLFATVGCPDDLGIASGQARYAPEVLDFGVVSVDGERRLALEVTNAGGSSLRVVDAAVDDDTRGVWRVEVPEALRTGLAPGAKASLPVVYRPCPEAWSGDAVDPAFDLDACPAAVDAADLVVTDDGGSARIALTGAPGLPPIAELYCPRTVDEDGCPMAIDRTAPCTSLRFGTIGLGHSCEADIEIVNRRRRGGRTADLLVQSRWLRVRSLDSGDVFDGTDGGFELLDEARDPLSPSAASPVVVGIPEGEDDGRVRLKVRYTTALEGVLAGDRGQGAGLRLGTNAPETPELSASLYATGVIPTVVLDPAGTPVRLLADVGATESLRFTLRNVGPGDAVIERVRLEPEHPELRLTDPPTSQIVREGERVTFDLVYARTSEELARTRLSVEMRDPVHDPAWANINPDLSADDCIFAPPSVAFGSTAGGELTSNLTVRAAGTGCTIHELDITRPAPSPAGEFTIDLPQCSNLPCDPGIVLCAPLSPDCTTNEAQIPLRFRNLDSSTQDLGELHLRTSERDDPQRLVVLHAEDDPCIAPVPVITVQTPEPCAGEPVVVDALQSLPGGRSSPPGTIVDWQWSFVFGTGGEFIPPNAAQTTFVPPGAGVLQVSLSVTNDCGATSQTAAQEQILVQANCP